MPTINYRVDRIEGARTGDEANSVEIKSNFAILSVKQEKNPSIGDMLNIAFRFEVDYEPNLGKMKIEGSLWYTDKDLSKLVSEKDGKVKMEPELVKAVTTSIVRESLLEVIDLSKKLRLPVPIKLPSVEMKPTKLEFKKTA
jgi:hypothetical protein